MVRATNLAREVGEAKRYSSGLWEESSREPVERDIERMDAAARKSARNVCACAAALPLIGIAVAYGETSIAIACFIVGLLVSLLYQQGKLARSLRLARRDTKISLFARDEGDLGPAYVMDRKVHNLLRDELLIEMEVLEPNIMWRLNSKEVQPSILRMQKVALPSKTVGFNMELVRTGDDTATRDLTLLEIAEIRRVAGKMMRNSLLFQVAVLMAIFVTPGLIFGIIATVQGGYSNGGPIFLTCAIVLAIFFGAGYFGDKGVFGESLKLRKAAKNGYAVMVKDAIDDDGVFSYVAEYLTVTGGIWTLDGEPAEWRLEYLNG